MLSASSNGSREKSNRFCLRGRVGKSSRSRTRYEMAYVVRNARSVPATVVVRQGGLGRDGKVAKESLPSKRIDAYNLSWDVSVPANGETRLTATIEAGW